ncbi:MAG: DUF1552 domain-containing protein [Verrucomicrobiota bacterium]
MRPISRRALLKGFGAAGVLAYPLLRARRAEAAPIKRFITFFSSSGVRQDTYWPKGLPGTFASGSYNVDGTTLDVLKPHLADLTLTKGISIYNNGGDDHDSGAVTLLTGNKVRSPTQTPYAMGESLDQYLGRQIGTATAEPTLLLATRLQRDRPSKWLAFDQTGNYKEYNQDPYSVYARLFQGTLGNCAAASPAATDAAKDLLNLRRQSVLDSVMSESSALKRSFGMGSAELSKLDRLETAIRSVERRLTGPATGTQSVATCQAAKATFATGTPLAITDPNFPALTKMNIDLIALAVELDVTRIVTMMLTQGGLSGPPMTWLTYAGKPLNEAHHPISHGEQRGVSDYLTKLEVVDRWNFTQFGYLLDKLKAIQESGATALDNSVVWFASDCADGKAHSHTDMPFIIAGRAAGEFKTGRYEAVTGKPLHQRLLLTFASLMGQKALTSWGLPESSVGGPILL